LFFNEIELLSHSVLCKKTCVISSVQLVSVANNSTNTQFDFDTICVLYPNCDITPNIFCRCQRVWLLVWENQSNPGRSISIMLEFMALFRLPKQVKG